MSVLFQPTGPCFYLQLNGYKTLQTYLLHINEKVGRFKITIEGKLAVEFYCQNARNKCIILIMVKKDMLIYPVFLYISRGHKKQQKRNSR